MAACQGPDTTADRLAAAQRRRRSVDVARSTALPILATALLLTGCFTLLQLVDAHRGVRLHTYGSRNLDRRNASRDNALLARTRQPYPAINWFSASKDTGTLRVTSRATVGASWVILDVLGGLVPIIIDAATGKWNSLDRETCNINLPQASSLATGTRGSPSTWTRDPDGNLHPRFPRNLHPRFPRNLHSRFPRNLHPRFPRNLHPRFPRNLHPRFLWSLHP